VSCNIRFKILLVEDNVTFRWVLKQSLHEFFPCMIIAEAGDGEEAHPERPIVILTSYDLPEDRQLAYQYGANSFLVKGSFTLGDLITEVESLISASDVHS